MRKVLDADVGARVAHARDDVVTLDVGVLIDAVGDLQGEQRQADVGVVGSGPQPVHVPTTGQQPIRRRVPKADVMALLGVVLPASCW